MAVQGRVAGGQAFAAVLTVREATQAGAAEVVLELLEPGWRVVPLPGQTAGQQRLLVQVDDEAALRRLLGAARQCARVLSGVDRLWAMSAGGRVQVRSRLPVRSAEDVSLAYTPGVARLAAAIAARPNVAVEVTGRCNRVAVIAEGTAVLGLGALGPLAALPVVEGKAALLAHLGDIDAVPMCMRTDNAEHLLTVVRALAPTFGGIHVQDIAAPAGADGSRWLQMQLDIPVFDEDEHGTAVVVLAALRNALRVAGKQLQAARIVVLDAGRAAPAVARLLVRAGATGVTVWSGRIAGEIPTGRVAGHVVGHGTSQVAGSGASVAGAPAGVGPVERRSPRRMTGPLAQALTGVDAVIGFSGPGGAVELTPDLVSVMARAPVVFALADPDLPVGADLVPGRAAVVVTGRPDHPSQITNALASVGLLRGALNARAPRISTAMRLAAADVLAGLVCEEQLTARRLLPDVLDPQVVPTVAAAVAAVEASRRRALRDTSCRAEGR